MFTEIKTTKVYEQVIVQIKDMINSGTLKKGDKLPSERELASGLGVSRASIREALRALEVIGLISCRQGEGNFVRESFDDNLFEPLSVMFTLNQSKPSDIFDLRRVMEVETAALAAKSITKKELEELKKLIDDMNDCEDEEKKVKLDKKFHYKIAKASKNFLIVTVLSTLSTLIDSLIKDARAQILKNKKNEEIIDLQHKSIVDALEKGDSEEAASMMRIHMKLINENLIELS